MRKRATDTRHQSNKADIHTRTHPTKVSVADWLGTLARLAGDPDPTDHKAAGAVPAVPPIDSVDVWPLVIGANTTSPRTVLPVDPSTILVGRHKLIVTPGHTFVNAAGWTGPIYPNSTTAAANRSAAKVHLR